MSGLSTVPILKTQITMPRNTKTAHRNSPLWLLHNSDDEHVKSAMNRTWAVSCDVLTKIKVHALLFLGATLELQKSHPNKQVHACEVQRGLKSSPLWIERLLVFMVLHSKITPMILNLFRH